MRPCHLMIGTDTSAGLSRSQYSAADSLGSHNLYQCHLTPRTALCLRFVHDGAMRNNENSDYFLNLSIPCHSPSWKDSSLTSKSQKVISACVSAENWKEKSLLLLPRKLQEKTEALYN